MAKRQDDKPKAGTFSLTEKVDRLAEKLSEMDDKLNDILEAIKDADPSESRYEG